MLKAIYETQLLKIKKKNGMLRNQKKIHFFVL